MKTKLLLIVAACFAFAATQAQNALYWDQNYFSSCHNSTNNVSSPTNSGAFGFTTADTTWPALIPGNAMRDTLFFYNGTPPSGISVTSLKFDSIYLPAGLCWSTNKTNNTITNGQTIAIVISGTPTSAQGTYKLRMIVDLTYAGVNLTNQDLEPLSRLRYHAWVGCQTMGHPYASDTVSPFIASTYQCPPPFRAHIYGTTPWGGVCVDTFPASATLTADTGSQYTYLWSTGATTQSISCTTGGGYSVTVTDNAAGVSASASFMTWFLQKPTAYFTLTQDPATAHSWIVNNQCAGADISYTWMWGDQSYDTIATPSHTYDSAGYYNICVSVSDTLGCSASYCDSNTYLYKTDGQMVSLTVVQYPLGVTGLTPPDMKMSYYGHAIHFSELVSDPAEVALYDLAGRVVLQRRDWTGNSLSIDNSLADGIYTVRLLYHGHQLSGRIGIVK
ncbi:MAG: PKD domain-containing protein [Bacteroidetes bacterium]|nr:PKD domain-containing protein [Bacteroidota bacterium]